MVDPAHGRPEAAVANDTHGVRASERLDWQALAAWVRREWPADDRTPAVTAALAHEPVVEQFGGGHSNLTYLVTFGALELVLRRPPLGPVPPRAHDMAREFRWLAALHPQFPLAPQPCLLCEDISVLGSVFYLMERRRGLVVRHEEPPVLAGRMETRRGISLALIDTLAALHLVDATSPELSTLGKPAGFVTRQVRGWTDRWNAAQLDKHAEMEAVAHWLASHLPPEPARASVVHGDFKLDNVVLDPENPERVVGVLDWEMCALGDPLVDVGIFLGYWLPTPGEAATRDALSTVSDRPGYLKRDALLERYAARTAADLTHLAFYETFAVFKLAVVLQQIYVRFVRGQTDDPRFAALGPRVDRLIRRAAQLADRHL